MFPNKFDTRIILKFLKVRPGDQIDSKTVDSAIDLLNNVALRKNPTEELLKKLEHKIDRIEMILEKFIEKCDK